MESRSMRKTMAPRRNHRVSNSKISSLSNNSKHFGSGPEADKIHSGIDFRERLNQSKSHKMNSCSQLKCIPPQLQVQPPQEEQKQRKNLHQRVQSSPHLKTGSHRHFQPPLLCKHESLSSSCILQGTKKDNVNQPALKSPTGVTRLDRHLEFEQKPHRNVAARNKKSHQSSDHSLVSFADESYKRHDYSRAIELYKEAVSLHDEGASNQHKKLSANADDPASDVDQEDISLSSSSCPSDCNGKTNITDLKSDFMDIYDKAPKVIITAGILLKQGNAELKASQFDDALKTFKKALKMLHFILERERIVWHRIQSSPYHGQMKRLSATKRHELKIVLSHIWNNIGNVYLKEKAYPNALEAYEEAFRIKLKLIHHTRGSIREIGRGSKKRGPSQPRSCLASQASSGAPLVSDSKSLVQLELDIGRTLHNIGLVLSNTNKHKLAMETYEEALKWKRKYSEKKTEKRCGKPLQGLSVAHTLVSIGDGFLRMAEERNPKNQLDASNDNDNGGENESQEIQKDCTEKKPFDENSPERSNDRKSEVSHEAQTSCRTSDQQKNPNTQDEMVCIQHYRKRNIHRIKQLTEALQKYQEALSLQRQSLGPVHLIIASTLHNICITTYHLEYYDVAVTMGEEALEIQNKLLSKDDARIGSTNHAIGMALLKLGTKQVTCLDMLQRALRIKLIHTKCINEQEDLGVLTVKFHVGKVYHRLNNGNSNVDYAMGLFQEVHQGRKLKLGCNHDAVATVLLQIGNVNNYDWKMYDKAIEIYREVLRVKQMALGNYHVFLAEIFHHLGVAYSKKEEIEHAVENFQSAIHIYNLHHNNLDKKKIGPYEMNIADALKCIADLRQGQGRFKDALHMYQDLIERSERRRRLQGWSTEEDSDDGNDIYEADLYNIIGNINFKTGDYASSKAGYKTSLRTKQKLLHPDDASLLTTLNNLGHSQYKSRELNEAMTTYQHALNLRKTKLLCLIAVEDFDDALLQVADRFANDSFQEEMKDTVSDLLGGIASTLNNIGLIHRDFGNMQDVLDVYKLSLSVWNIQPVHHYAAIAITVEKSGLLQFSMGMYDEAKISFFEALRVKKLKQGELTVDVAHTLNSIGNVYYSQGDLDESMKFYKEALEIKKKLLGEDHVDIANTINNIGNVYHSKGDFDEAIFAYTKALYIKRMALGDIHLDVAATLSNIGDVQCKRKNMEDALSVYEEALKIREKLGANNLDVAILLSNIGKIYQWNDKFEEAAEVFFKEVRVRKLDAATNKNESLVISLTNLGRAHHKCGHLDDALRAYKEALLLNEHKLKQIDQLDSSSKRFPEKSALGGNAADTSEARGVVLDNLFSLFCNIAHVYKDMRALEKAINTYKAALKYRKQQVGSDHLDVAMLIENIGMCLFHNNNYEKSIAYLSEALRLKTHNLGEDHVKVADTLSNIGEVRFTMGKLDKAMYAFSKAFLIKKTILGENNLEVATMVNNIANVYVEEGEVDEAIKAYMEALRIRRAKLGDDDIVVASTLLNLGDLYAKKDDNTFAMECYQQTFQIRILQLGKQHLDVAFVLEKIARIHAGEDDIDSAIECYTKSLRIKEQILGEENLDTVGTLEDLAIIYRKKGESDKALTMFTQALQVKKMNMGEHHLDVKKTETQLALTRNMPESRTNGEIEH